MIELVLASQSPRRKFLLTQLGYTFCCQPANIDETVKENESASDYVARLSLAKAQEIANRQSSKNIAVLGSDTSVVYQHNILGKPTHFADFERMMNLLSGHVHQVLTAIAIVCKDRSEIQVVTTDVSFKQLTSLEISDYWQTGEPCDKAGGYGIQGIGGKFVTNVNGSYSAVVGLPLYETNEMLTRFQVKV